MSTKGLEGVIAAETRLSKVFGEEGRLVYNGYEIEDLAEHTSFEEVCHLLWYGALPTAAQLDTLRRQFSEATVPNEVLEIVRLAPSGTHPMAVLRTAVSALGFFDEDGEDTSAEANQRKAIRLVAQTIIVTAAIDRLRKGLASVGPRTDLSLAGNFLYMLNGEEANELRTRIVDVALILHAEHGMNASTFAARVAAGTMADMHGAVTAAMATLKGPLHGGANERVMAMLRAVGDAGNARDWVLRALDRHEKIMGFGHRVYRALDPRAPILEKLAGELGEAQGDTRWLDVSERIRGVMREEMDKKGKAIYPNVDFFSASVYHTLGIPQDLFTNVFACARMAGWTAHVIEQQNDNRLIRPRSEYTGALGLKVQPIDSRG